MERWQDPRGITQRWIELSDAKIWVRDASPVMKKKKSRNHDHHVKGNKSNNKKSFVVFVSFHMISILVVEVIENSVICGM